MTITALTVRKVSSFDDNTLLSRMTPIFSKKSNATAKKKSNQEYVGASSNTR